MAIEKIKGLFKLKNIVFYFDEDGSFKEELSEIKEAGIKVIEVTQNYFELKYNIEMNWKGEKLFLYHSFPKPKLPEIKKYPLLDLLKANVELRTDDASEFMSEYGIPDSQLSLVNRYIKQLKTKTNQKKLAGILDVGSFNESNLKRGLISIALDFSKVASRNESIMKCINITLEENKFTKLQNSFKEQELEEDVLDWFNLLLDTQQKEFTQEAIIEWVKKIKYNILTAYIENTKKEDTYSSLKLQKTADVNKLLAFYQDWQEHKQFGDKIEAVFEELGGDIEAKKVLEWYEEESQFGYYSEEMINTIIIDLYKSSEENPLKTVDHCIKWQRSSSLSTDHQHQISFIYHTASLNAVLEAYTSFRFNTTEEFIKEYTKELYKVDLHFRKALIAFDSVRDRLYEFEEHAQKVFSNLNAKYDRFLIDLNVEWQTLLSEKQFNFKEIEVDKQYEFYQKNIQSTEVKKVVIISDALRYEVGVEIYEDLLSDSKNNMSIAPSLASIPSYTNLGMSNLLPNKGIAIDFKEGDKDYSFKIEGKSTISSNRASILQSADPSSTAIDYSEIIKYNRTQGRTLFKDHKIVYIYHDWIDTIGDKKRTEHQTFEATTKAVEDIKRLTSKLYGWNVYNILITSDHGFLYNYNDLTDQSREDLPKVKGFAKEHVRFVLAEDFKGKVEGYQMNLSATTNIQSDLKVAIPRATNRFKKQGNVGAQFVHGGGSLQELVTPVIKFFKGREEASEAVSFQRIDQTEKITSGSFKALFLQDKPVSNEYKSLEISIALYSQTGDVLSNITSITLNSTSSNPKERISEVIITLNSKGSAAAFGYLRAYDKKDKSKLNPLMDDTIKIISLMEKDDF